MPAAAFQEFAGVFLSSFAAQIFCQILCQASELQRYKSDKREWSHHEAREEGTTPRKQMQETAFSVQLVPGTRFLVIDVAVYRDRTAPASLGAEAMEHAISSARKQEEDEKSEEDDINVSCKNVTAQLKYF